MKHLSLSDINPDNYHLYVEKPDKNFSPKRNYQIIQQVLDENAKMQKNINDEVKKNAENVTDILASWTKYKLDTGGEKKIDAWLGRRLQRELYGDQLMEKVRMMEIIRAKNLKNGNNLYGGNFYLK